MARKEVFTGLLVLCITGMYTAEAQARPDDGRKVEDKAKDPPRPPPPPPVKETQR